MAVTTVALSSVGQTHYGTPPNNVGAFTGVLAYNQQTATTGNITVTIQNITDPSVRGSIVAIGLAVPAGSTVTSAAVVYSDCGFDALVATQDCRDGITGYGNCRISLLIQGRSWNCTGVIPWGPRAGIRSFQTGTISINIVGTVLGSLTATDWHGAVTSGTHAVFFPVHFRWLNDNDITSSVTANGDDFVSSS